MQFVLTAPRWTFGGAARPPDEVEELDALSF